MNLFQIVSCRDNRVRDSEVRLYLISSKLNFIIKCLNIVSGANLISNLFPAVFRSILYLSAIKGEGNHI